MSFTFNNNYHDKEQVRQWMPAFTALRVSMEASGKYPYNDCFKGKIAGIEGPDEDTAIYILQCLYSIERENEKMAKLRAEMQPLKELNEQKRFSRVVLYKAGHYVGGTGSFMTLEDARILPKDGKPFAVIPKGKRTNGYRIDGAEVLVTEA
jgi:hypothetical protein